jgi:hypothetical protein
LDASGDNKCKIEIISTEAEFIDLSHVRLSIASTEKRMYSHGKSPGDMTADY